MKRNKLWLFMAIIYGVFFYWYTDFAGAVSEQEIKQWKQTMLANGADREKIAYYETFLQQDTGKQFFMINTLDLHTAAIDESDETPEQLLAKYTEHILLELPKRGSHPVLFGNASYSAIDLVGLPDAKQWDQGAVIRYRSRRAFMQVVANPVTRDFHRFKTAALQKTIAYPIEMNFYPGDLRLLLALLLITAATLIQAFVGLLQRQLS